MSAAEKPSVSGLMVQSHEVSRFENLFFKAVNTAYYNATWGLDWLFWLGDDHDYVLSSFISYMTQDAMTRGIVIEKVDSGIKDFTLNMTVTIEGITFSTDRELGE